MAAVAGVSPASVGRIWAAHGLKPHRTKTFKLSNNKHFEEKLNDIVGLHLNPPEHALVYCCDEKSQIQALDRTQPGLPLKEGRCQTMTHDYKRNGTTSLFAALNTADGKVIGTCMNKHRRQEWLRFLSWCEQSRTAGKQSRTERAAKQDSAFPAHPKRSEGGRECACGPFFVIVAE